MFSTRTLSSTTKAIPPPSSTKPTSELVLSTSYSLYCLYRSVLMLASCSCRQAISKNSVFQLAAFQPTDEQVVAATGVADEEDELEDAPVAPRPAKQNNTRVIVDSDDEGAPEEPDISSKKAGKQKEKPEKKKVEKEADWNEVQEPSTKMRWLLAEIQRCEVE